MPIPSKRSYSFKAFNQNSIHISDLSHVHYVAPY
jgi:hypothetical protein